MRRALVIASFIVSCASPQRITTPFDPAKRDLRKVEATHLTVECARESGFAWFSEGDDLVLHDLRAPMFSRARTVDGVDTPRAARVRETNIGGGRRVIGVDAGELGGSLWLIDKDGTAQTVVAEMDPVIAVVPVDDRDVIVVSGIAHLGFNRGVVARWSFAAAPVQINETALDSAPQAANMYGKNLLVVTLKSITLFDDAGTVTLPLDERIVRAGVVSVMPSNGSLVVGTHLLLAIVPIPPSNHAITWYAPTACIPGRSCC